MSRNYGLHKFSRYMLSCTRGECVCELIDNVNLFTFFFRDNLPFFTVLLSRRSSSACISRRKKLISIFPILFFVRDHHPTPSSSSIHSNCHMLLHIQQLFSSPRDFFVILFHFSSHACPALFLTFLWNSIHKCQPIDWVDTKKKHTKKNCSFLELVCCALLRS